MAHAPFFSRIGVSSGAMPDAEAAFVAILAQVHPQQFKACELMHGDHCLFDYTRTRTFYDMDCFIACVTAHADELVHRLEKTRLFCEFRSAMRPDVPRVLLLLLYLKGFMLKREARVRIEDGAAFKQAVGDVFLSKKEKMAVAEMYNGNHFGADDYCVLYDAVFSHGQIDPQ